jgi:membrane-bound ClpP family serine protease
MMTLLIVLAVAGLLLIVAEIVFIPGTTVVGIFGGLLSAYSIFKAYETFGLSTGHVFLASCLIGGAIILILCFRANVWNRFANNSVSEGKAMEDLDQDLSVGDEGSTLSDLRPIGKAEFKGKTYEVQTLGTFCNHPSKISIIEISRYKIIVQPLT